MVSEMTFVLVMLGVALVGIVVWLVMDLRDRQRRGITELRWDEAISRVAPVIAITLAMLLSGSVRASARRRQAFWTPELRELVLEHQFPDAVPNPSSNPNPPAKRKDMR